MEITPQGRMILGIRNICVEGSLDSNLSPAFVQFAIEKPELCTTCCSHEWNIIMSSRLRTRQI